MFVERLELRDFRCYEHVAVAFGPGAQVLVGANAQGKTALLEAVHYLALGASHRVASDTPLVRQGAESAVIRASARLDGNPGHPATVEYELRPGGRSRARVNGQPQPRARDALGLVRSVMFAPEDLQLVRGDPADRRRFLDDLLSQRRPAYRAARQEYDRVLRQRNALLRARQRGAPRRAPEAEAGTDTATLEVWTDALVNAGAGVLAARIAAVHALAGPCESAYRDLVSASPASASAGMVRLVYESSTGRSIPAEPGEGVPDVAALAEELREGLAAAASAEQERGLTLVGPHRDELAVELRGMPARGYASHGELWSLALSLRLASRDVLADVGDEPVVLLDDVFAELDDHRRQRLAERCAGFGQVLVTAAVDEDVPLTGPRLVVDQAQVWSPGAGQGVA